MERVAIRLRTARRLCRTVVLRMRFEDFSRATRSHTVAEATDRTEVILAIATALLKSSMPTIETRGLTLIGIALANLVDNRTVQLVLPFDRARELDAAVDGVRARFGTGALTRGVLVGRDPGVWVPLLPD